MRYRKFGTLDINVSALGFGAMRLPLQEEGVPANIDNATAIAMMEYAFDHGVNYVDTAYLYHEGQSELVVGEVLNNGYRDSVYLATKMPTWAINTYDDFDRFLNEQLQRLQVDQIDFYLLHNVNTVRWPKLRDLGVLEWGEKARADGRIRYLGFSFHETFDLFKEIVDTYDWPMCLIQHNYVNVNVQVGTKGLQYAAQKAMAVVIMEPLLGGGLAHFPEPIQAVWERTKAKRTPVDMALQWLWNMPEVSLVLSGMSTMEQVRQNVDSACTSGVGILTPDELDIIAQVQKQYKALNPIPCTKCGYCMPCPQGVNIPYNVELYNELKMHPQSVPMVKGNTENVNQVWYGNLPEEMAASACIACKECEKKCPQHIPLSGWMPRIHETFRPK
jgi:predicted aldo/keto reductase-like oxidoreductase